MRWGTGFVRVLLVAAVAVSLAGCATTAPDPGGGTGTPSSSSSSTTEPSGTPSGDRFAYTCAVATGAPDIQANTLTRLWADGNYTRISSCTVEYVGPEPFVPTEEEASALTEAGVSADGDEALATVLELQQLCTRISDETGPGGFADQTAEMLNAAVELCPDAPQAQIMSAWAVGERFGDGSHTVGEDAAAGVYTTIHNAPDSCRWTVQGADGAMTSSGGATEALDGVTLSAGDVFTSENCGIWWQMP